MFAEGGWAGANHIDMAGETALRVEQANRPRDVEAPVTSLRHVLRVAELLHQLVTGLGVLGNSEARLGHAGRPGEVGQTGSYDVEGDAVGACAEGLQHFGDFEVRARPAVNEE